MRRYQGFTRQSDAFLLKLFELALEYPQQKLIDWLDGRAFEEKLKTVKVKEKAVPRHRWNVVIKRFEAQGWLKQKKIRDRLVVHLTHEGVRRAWQLRIRCASIAQRKSDKRVCVVVFDIPEDYRNARDNLRYFLKESGFAQLQRSVWVCPSAVTSDIISFAKHLKIQPWVRVISGTLEL